MPVERRNRTSVGRKRRAEFERSLKTLHELGMPRWAVEYYRRFARIAGLLPEEVVIRIAVVEAARRLVADHEAALAGPEVPVLEPRYPSIETFLHA